MSLDGPELEMEEGPEGPGEKLLRTLGGDRGSASPLPRIYVREYSLFLLRPPNTLPIQSLRLTPRELISSLRDTHYDPGFERQQKELKEFNK